MGIGHFEHKVQNEEQEHADQHYDDGREQSHQPVALRLAELGDEHARHGDDAEEGAAEQEQPCGVPRTRGHAYDDIDDDESKSDRNGTGDRQRDFTLGVLHLVLLFFEVLETGGEIAEAFDAHIVDELFVLDALYAQVLHLVHQFFERADTEILCGFRWLDAPELLFQILFESVLKFHKHPPLWLASYVLPLGITPIKRPPRLKVTHFAQFFAPLPQTALAALLAVG